MGTKNIQRIADNAHLENLSVLDGIAILMVLLFHSHFTAFASWDYVGSPAVHWLVASSGFKLTFNHYDDFNNKLFMRPYLQKRFIRLCKPYIGYTLLVLLPLLALVFVCDILNISQFFLETFQPFKLFVTSSPTEILQAFLLGKPIVAGHLYFLFSLLMVTVTCLCVIYVLGTKVFFAAPFLLIISWFVRFYYDFMIMFILGMFFAYLFRRLAIQLPVFYGGVLSFCGRNAFQIYILHQPFIQPLVYLVLVPIIHLPMNIVTTIIEVSLTIVIIMYIYDLMKSIGINRLIE